MGVFHFNTKNVLAADSIRTENEPVQLIELYKNRENTTYITSREVLPFKTVSRNNHEESYSLIEHKSNTNSFPEIRDCLIRAYLQLKDIYTRQFDDFKEIRLLHNEGAAFKMGDKVRAVEKMDLGLEMEVVDVLDEEGLIQCEYLTKLLWFQSRDLILITPSENEIFFE